ncbi:MAG TPA: hypothetical protein VGE65_02310 [Sphingobium sp.]
MQWIVLAAILVFAVWYVPASVRSMKRSRQGRLGSAMIGIATALDPAKAMIVAEEEKRQTMDGEEVDGDDEPLAGKHS